MNSLYSHPEVLLKDHLREVAEGCAGLLAGKSLGLSLPEGLIENVGYLMGATHDIGKATRFFQHYLRSETHEITGPKHHALLSAYLCRELAAQLMDQYDSLPELDRVLLPYLMFLAVKRHHGNLQNIDQEFLSLEDKAPDLVEQIKVIDRPAVSAILEGLLGRLGLTCHWGGFAEMILQQQFLETYDDFHWEYIESEPFSGLSPEAKTRYYYLFQLIYSSLLLADKRDVILTEAPKHLPIVDNPVEAFRKKKGFDRPRSALATAQNEAYSLSLSHLQEIFSPAQHLYSLTLPTGMGKTITSLAVARKLQRLLGEESSRLIIAIPFTSIIDQNYLVYEEVLQTTTSSQLLKHHHLSTPHYKTAEDGLSADQSQFLIETWDSQVVVTTFVQLIEALFTNNKTKLLKLPQLANAVVILDEIQSIPYRLWPLIRAGIQQVAKMYNTYFMFLSATQPLIFQPGEEILEIVPAYKSYFEKGLFNRTKLINKTDKVISLEDFVVTVIEYARAHPAKDILIVLNTKSATRSCFEMLREAEVEESELLFLATSITPFERKTIIKRIKQRPHTKRLIIVSTQLIEAGVDISVHTIFRALAPMDSIIQAAGRANRKNELPEPAEVFLYEIKELIKTSSMIYGPALLNKTRNVLAGKMEVEETGFLDLIESYYQEVKIQADTVSNDTLDALLELKFKDVGAFQLIPEQETESVFIQINEEAQAVWNRYVALYEDTSLSFLERKQQFAAFKATFYDFVINVRIPYKASNIDFDRLKQFGFYLSELDHPSAYYHYDPDDFSRNIGYTAAQTLTF